MVTEEEVFAPNSTSLIFWLKNRKSKEWRDKQELLHGMSDYLHESMKDKSIDELLKIANNGK